MCSKLYYKPAMIRITVCTLSLRYEVVATSVGRVRLEWRWEHSIKKISNYNKHSWVVTKINTTYWYRHLASLWKEQNSLIDDITRNIAFWNKPKRRNVFRMRFVRVYFILYSLSHFKQYFYYLKSSGECTIASTIELRIMARSCSCIEKGMGSPGCVSWSAQLLEIIFFK